MNTERPRSIDNLGDSNRIAQMSTSVSNSPNVLDNDRLFMTRHKTFFIAITSMLGIYFCSTIVGCGYTVGKSFVRDIKTVDVPIFDNDTNRQGIEKQLTEAVQKEITKRSPYRLAKGLEADTRLTGRIVSLRKDVLGETAQDDARELQISMMVKVTWEDIRSGQILAQEELPLSPDAIPLTSQAEFSPESGESLATAMDDVFKTMARRIVNLMEAPW